ncbi:GroES-like protein [Tothia fuscella]|uniref:GroES-like protein n=1 Tax=Tothia fuscella TaxID=1048955 RepID=A0A9P4NRH2_9PEZI|nr:GroES-like protein [Tothia fuscella]
MAAQTPKRMKAIQLVEFDSPYEVREVDIPTNLDPSDLLIKVAAASYCHSDAMVQSGMFSAPLPLTAGHEGSGTVVAVGAKAAKKFQIGDRVMCGLPQHPCDNCDECSGPESQQQYCTNLEYGFLGLNTNGCFAEFVKCDSRFTAKLPDKVSLLSAAPLACAGRTAWRAVLKTQLKPGEWVCFIGSGGGLGHLGVQFAKALGLRVIGVDATDKGLEVSRKHGADPVVDIRGGNIDVVRKVQTATGGKGAHATICLSDHKDASAIACALTRMHGTMIQIALTEIVAIPMKELIFRDIRVIGSNASGVKETEAMLATVATHGVAVTTVPFEGLHEIGQLCELFHSGSLGGRALIVIDQEQIDLQEKNLE